jgi:hypothetical protein
MTMLDIKAALLGIVSVGVVLVLWLAGVLLLRVFGFTELTLESAVAWRFLVFPHDLVIATARGPRVFPGVVAPFVAILQWLVVGLCVGWLTRKRSTAFRLLIASVLVGLVGWVVRIAIFRVLGYQAAFP